MSVSVENLDGLKRRLTIQLPPDDLEKTYQARLNQVAKKVKVDGFRVGKVKPHVIEARFGNGVREEVAGELMQKRFDEIVHEKHLHIAGRPHVEKRKIVKGEPAEFVIAFEVYPEINLKSLAGQSVEKFKVDILDQDVDHLLGTLQKQQAEWSETDRAAKEGDRVVIDFEGFIDGKTFDRGAAKEFQLEIGSKQMLPGFEEGLVGQKPGETKDIQVTFPKEYPAADLAGKKALFKIVLHKVLEPKLPVINDELAKKIGIKEGGLEKLRSEIKTNMEREAQQFVRGQLKMQTLDKLMEANPIEVPEALVEGEILHLQEMTRQQIAMQTQKPEEAKKLELPREPYVKQAKKRVILGLLLAEVIRKHNLKAEPGKVRERVEEIAKAYQKPEEIVSWYYNNKKVLAEIESIVLEDIAVDQLLTEANLKEKSIAYEEASRLAKQTREGVE